MSVRDGEDEVELFMQQFKGAAAEIEWGERKVLLHLCSSLVRPAKAYGCGETTETIVQALQTRYGFSVRPAKERQMKMKKDPQGSVYDLVIEIRNLVSLAHSYIPLGG